MAGVEVANVPEQKLIQNLEKDAKQAAVCKLHLDLWLHQNTLMWGRVQTLGFVQAGFLTLAYTLWREESLKKYAVWACLLGVLVTFGLGVVMWTDRWLRNLHREPIEAFGLNLYPASTSNTPISEDLGASVIEPAFHFLIFLAFIIIDLLAASVLGLPEPWVAGYSVALFLGFVLTVAHFYRKAEMVKARSKRKRGT